MVIFFSIVLVISIMGMLSLLWLKRYELNTGHVFMADSRIGLGERFEALAWTLKRHMPALLRSVAAEAGRALMALTHRAVAWAVITIEHVLERVLHTVREKTTHTHTGAEASAFLREVADHKKELQRRRTRRSIHE